MIRFAVRSRLLRYRAQRARRAHKRRDLNTAMRRYDALLRTAPPHVCSGATLEAVLRFRPRIFINAAEPFALRDLVAIVHPEESLIAYHLFWEDDIEFPADQEPCDHEVCWVVYDPDTLRLRRFLTYFHGRALEGRLCEEWRVAGWSRGNKALSAAPDNCAGTMDDRPALYVQWGKHGSLPYGWENMGGGTVRGEMLDAYRRLRTEGARNADHPLSRDWPSFFTGRWEDFVHFPREIDPAGFLTEGGRSYISRFANATIMRYVLRYNFGAKVEWPETLTLVHREPGQGAEPEVPVSTALHVAGGTR